MRSVLESCKPKKSIIQGTFNPEVFTASLGPVLEYYRGSNANIDSIYTDAEAFFREATYPTDGLRTTVNNIFRRISGDMTAPSVQRMETAFGGGKTHTLIACVHIANKGIEIADAVKDIVDDPSILPEAHSVKVVGIAGDEIDLYKTHGERIVPYTLWGDMALQIGGDALYKQVKADAENYAAPGKSFFEKVLAGKKVLIMFDELAQYCARIEMYKPGQGSAQVASFLMALFGYARTNKGISIVLTLAGATDAFARQTGALITTMQRDGAEDTNRDHVITVAQNAVKGVSSVVSRDATVVTPVEASEISAVLAKRLFDYIDVDIAKEVAVEYEDIYSKNKSMLPDEATSINFKDRLIAYYPFHPTLIDFLNNKLAEAENFQGTRGVLRVLAMVVRSIWQTKRNVGMIHVSDIDMKISSIVDEILGKTGSSDLRLVLNADIGSIETHTLNGGLSNAQLADQENPHPDGIPFYENTWKTVFLNSLVGRTNEKSSKVFGVTEQDALFQVSTPLLHPSQVQTALQAISEKAFYLRYDNGKFFAHLDPTINSVLARIKEQIDGSRIKHKIAEVSNSLVSEGSIFRVVHNVQGPEDVDDKSEKPVIAAIGIDAPNIEIDDMYRFVGNRTPRFRQNLLLLLVPKTVKVKGYRTEGLFQDEVTTIEVKNNVETIARTVLAFRELESDPERYGISPEKLKDPGFKSRSSERSLALKTRVSELYDSLYYAGPDGFVKFTLHSASGDQGETITSQIEKELVDVGELILLSDKRFGSPRLKQLAADYFFKDNEKISCKNLLNNFYNKRNWPMLANKEVLERILREGIELGIWVAYKMSEDATDDKPAVIYSDKKHVPLDVTLYYSDLSIMPFAGAKKRGWLEDEKPANERVKNIITKMLQDEGAATVESIIEYVQYELPKAEADQIRENILDLVRQGEKFAIYKGTPGQQEKPDELIDGISAYTYELEDSDVVITRKEQSERGWLSGSWNGLRISGPEKAELVFKILDRIGSNYRRGVYKSEVDLLEITDLKLPGGGTIRIVLNDAQPNDFKRADEFFQDLHNFARVADNTTVDVEILNPVDGCGLVKDLKEE